MSGHTCLNCGQAVTTKYCGNCGQKAETHRFTFRHFVEHDIIHGVFHIDKGFPYTAKQLFLRPGYAIREYIEGRRISYFNPVTFLLLIIALNLFVQYSVGYNFESVFVKPDKEVATALQQVQHFQQKYMKQLYLGTIPLVSFCTWLVFRRSRKNYIEHLVMNTYKDGALLLLTTGFMLLASLSGNITYSRIVMGLMGLVTNLYAVYFYWQFFRQDYRSRVALFFSIVGAMLLYTFLSSLIMVTVLSSFILQKGH